jgi:hypothetical protein
MTDNRPHTEILTVPTTPRGPVTGSDGGGEHWAIIASLIETCKLCGVEPHAYLEDVITRIVNRHPNSKIDELLPWAYLAEPALKAVA